MNATATKIARYIVEAKDEFGWIDYDSFADADEALKLAAHLNRETSGAAQARVVDSVECVIVTEARMQIIDEIAAERRRQVEVEGWTPEHDDTHDRGEMAKAAACYAYGATEVRYPGRDPEFRNHIVSYVQHVWPWAASWFKPTNRRRDLVKAGALIVAEIERLDRAAAAAAAAKATS